MQKTGTTGLSGTAGKTPILSVVGNSGAGKTVYLEKLIPELKSRGLRLGIIKNDVHGFDIDIPGKDSWRLTRAGADSIMIVSPQKMALIEHWAKKESLEQTASRIKNVDLIITEGFRTGSAPKIEIRRTASGHEPIFEPGLLFAIVSDAVAPESPCPWFPLDNPKPLADYIINYMAY
ncbi:MAG: molybdopterin-guanine dinucleotide biosynthesis protein B [Treponema sp.]|nr:molybdopterin-guanine dinucleotide biosynthesis protein B [Treponema sp.]